MTNSLPSETDRPGFFGNLRVETQERPQHDIVLRLFSGLGAYWACGSEYNTADNLSLRPDQDSKSVSPPGRRNLLTVLIDIPVLDGVSEENIARDVTVDKADAEAVGMGLTARCFQPLTYDCTWSLVIPFPPFWTFVRHLYTRPYEDVSDRLSCGTG